LSLGRNLDLSALDGFAFRAISPMWTAKKAGVIPSGRQESC
jgi:hypothetical protein